ncbi:MAG: DUF6029 family protein [Bacteroidales bacterium]|jgi:hypothetical protein|nr:DUF6029 family protein [Bacteroidales bacterium]
MKRVLTVIGILLLSVEVGFCQGILGGKVTGSFQMDMQVSQKDSIIGAEKVSEKFLSNSFANILYTNGDFTAGVRFEAYLNPILGFDAQYKGAGFANRFASYKKDFLEVTVGNFYEQFGNGLILRSYEERNLGIDNAMDGLKVVARPIEGITIKGIIGKQRYYWEDVWQTDNGLIRGADLDLSLNELFPFMTDSPTRIGIGGSFISVYEKAQPKFIEIDSATYKYNLPENIGAAAFRFDLAHKAFNLSAEYARKGQDPNAINNFTYRNGEALFVTAGYSQKGLGISVAAKRIDNMSFKSRRNEVGNMLNVNYLPATTRQHAYSLMAMYPYATQVNGEMGLQADVMYKLQKGTALGGKYGTDLKLNYSRINSIDKQPLDANTALNQTGTKGYSSDFFKVGDDLYFEEIGIEVGKKFSSDFKTSFMYSYQSFNPIASGHEGFAFVYANIFVLDGTYKVAKNSSLRAEVQLLLTKANYGDWATGDWAQGTLEYNLAGKWFAALTDQWNYGNETGDKTHYYNVVVGYTFSTMRIQLGYGKQRKGIMCIGGVCREVPASNGLFATITSSF